MVETARRILDYTGGTLIMPMTVLIETYWREISDGFAVYDIPVRHFLLHTDSETLRERIMGDTVMGPSGVRLAYPTPYDEAFRGWLGAEADVIDTTAPTPADVGTAITVATRIPSLRGRTPSPGQLALPGSRSGNATSPAQFCT